MKKIKDFYSKLVHIKGVNKYTITLFIFIIIIVFIDDSNLINRLRVYREKQRIQSQIEKCKKEIKSNTDFIEAVSSNTEALEKFAREEYNMKKPNEDIYIINED